MAPQQDTLQGLDSSPRTPVFSELSLADSPGAYPPLQPYSQSSTARPAAEQHSSAQQSTDEEASKRLLDVESSGKQAASGNPSSSWQGDSADQEIASSSQRENAAAASCLCNLRGWAKDEPLLAATIAGVIAGIVLGMLVRLAEPSLATIDLIGFPGELMLRLLKLLVLPLVSGSMVAGVCALRGSSGNMAHVARTTLLYYTATTVTAVILGIVLVNLFCPGRGSPFGGSNVEDCHAGAAKETSAIPQGQQPFPLQALLEVARNMFPDNIARAAVDMNILGIITVSLLFGWCLSMLGPEADSWIRGVDVFNKVISKMVTAVLWVSPVGIASLIAASICRACNLGHTLAALGLWVTTVLVGLAIFGGLVLPGVLFAVTRQSPLRALKGFSQAIVMAFGTGSSSAALPVAMDCALKMGCDDAVVKFVLPLGTTVNMNGTALYEATTVIFIAQAHGVSLGLAQTVVVACTATLAAVGAAAIPSAGLVTMLMVMQAVSLDQFASDLAVILAVDWLLDRCRTAVNLTGDVFGCLLVDHVSKHRSGEATSDAQYTQLELT
ncbi:hypothetical protein WJX72_002273 [[Myrmecia] bisecta]|uniref:Amino acid transporter n=1 Tax=[Myrmecia] bisecta TaxID=41462 RepID=A0AAW1PBZ9_9CHLO